MALSESIFFSFFPKRIKSRAPQINQVLPIRKTLEIVSIFPHFQSIYSIFKYFNHIVLFSVLSLYGKFILLKHDFKEIDTTGTLEK